MARTTPWRREVSDACCWHQTEALASTIYLLRQTGPTGFLLKVDGQSRNVKVFLGDLHSCTCSVFKRERDLCVHICWLLLKKFKLSVNDPLSWQLGLVERELNEIIQGRNTADRDCHRNGKKHIREVQDEKNYVLQREIADDDVCPICQEQLLSKKLPVTYCKFSCGNTIHIKCMSIWADHQQKSSKDSSIKCPMCREDFGPIELLKTESRNAGVKKIPHGIRLDRHLGIACSQCSTAPIEGKCYRCTVCPAFNMCQRCFNLPVHMAHPFQFRQKSNQRWRSAVRSVGASLPPALVNELMSRDLSEDDYDTLLSLDRNSQETLSTLTEDGLQQLPIERLRERSTLLAPGSQCRVCLRSFTIGQFLRKLPCGHKFHRECIDGWLLHSHPTCPIDGVFAVQTERNSRDAPLTETRGEIPVSREQMGASDLVIGTSGTDHVIAQRRVNFHNNRQSPHCRPLMKTSVPAASGLELNGVQLCVNDTSPDSTLSGENARLLVPRHVHNSSHTRQRDSAEHCLTPGDLIQILQESAIQTEPEHSNTSIMEGQRRRTVFRQRPLNNGRNIPGIQATTSAMSDLYLGNNPRMQPPISEDTSRVSYLGRREPSRHRMRGLPRQLNGLFQDHEEHGTDNTNFQLEGNSIAVEQQHNGSMS